MKLTTSSKIVVSVCAIAILQLGQSAQAAETIPGVAEQPAAYFYTGKPYDSDLGSYTFNARNYNPEINRWTSNDPSGFPEGPNNSAYLAIPTSEVDPDGLQSLVATLSNYTFTISANGGSASKKDIGPTITNSSQDPITVTYQISGTLEVTSAAIPGGSASITIDASAEGSVRVGYTSHLDGRVTVSSQGAITYGFNFRTEAPTE